MLIFRMDESNFGQAERQGLRIVTGAGLRVDFDEFAPDPSTLGLWHLHDGACQGEGTGLEDESGGGHDLANLGADSIEDGYRLVHTGPDYLQASYPAQPAYAQLTLEAWVRQWQTPTGSHGSVMTYWLVSDDTRQVAIVASRNANPANSYITARLRKGGDNIGDATWWGAAADAILASSVPWHVAAVLDSPASMRLFVNGVQRAVDTVGIESMPGGDCRLWLGKYRASYPFYPSCVLDEVRLSAAARYAATFTPQRLLAAGIGANPTFDALRDLADWLDLDRVQSVPEGVSIAWEVRAADELDGFGHPQAPWEPYGGDPADLPDGRYFQWRATLSASADRLSTPTVESVEASASEAGYNLYHGAGPGPEAINYAAPLRLLGPNVTEIATGPLAAGAVHWFGLRPVDDRGLESPTAEAECRLELDASGEVVPDRPAGALGIQAAPRPLGRARLTWRYRPGSAGVLPEVFRIFGDGGTGTIDYETPLGEVPFDAGRTWYAWDSPPLADGLDHLLAVRAVADGGVWDEQPAIAGVRADSSPPLIVDALEAEVIP
jgi:hypothetical protein